MPDKPFRHNLELLSPATNKDIAIEAIRHGADAVYLGATSHGARKSASNSLDDIAEVIDYAHVFRARVYVTVNTIVYENELRRVEQLCRDLYHIGADALIVQDMSLLRMNLPPIALHASTQCDIRTPEKAEFLQNVGFSQLVLARELGLNEIKAITDVVRIPVECFVHGALCVSYSGRCHASQVAYGRSANRGECAQICRLPYTLTDANGKIISKERHLLSLKDFNASHSIPKLIESGVSSFKIEGRLKDIGYVKNVTAHYDKILNTYIREHDGFRRSSFGISETTFEPQLNKSFNRGFTEYFLKERRPEHIASLETPKSMGETIANLSQLHNGDGISYFDKGGNYVGSNINKVEKDFVLTAGGQRITSASGLHRTLDIEWQKQLNRNNTASRKINIDIDIDKKGISAHDERGVFIRIPLGIDIEKSNRPMDYQADFNRFGNTNYKLGNFASQLDDMTFIPKSYIGDLRRAIVEQLDSANLASYPFQYKQREDMQAIYPVKHLDFRDNVANSLAEEFYRSHGVTRLERAIETKDKESKKRKGITVMTTRHCILRELGLCKRLVRGKFQEPLTIKRADLNYRLHFNCADCEMEVITD